MNKILMLKNIYWMKWNINIKVYRLTDSLRLKNPDFSVEVRVNKRLSWTLPMIWLWCILPERYLRAKVYERLPKAREWRYRRFHWGVTTASLDAEKNSVHPHRLKPKSIPERCCSKGTSLTAGTRHPRRCDCSENKKCKFRGHSSLSLLVIA